MVISYNWNRKYIGRFTEKVRFEYISEKNQSCESYAKGLRQNCTWWVGGTAWELVVWVERDELDSGNILIGLFGYNWHATNWTYVKCTTVFVLTYAYTNETISAVKRVKTSITLKRSSLLNYNISIPGFIPLYR